MNLPIIASLQVATERNSQRNTANRDLADTCRDFEAVFLKALFKGMRSTGIEGGLFEKSNDQEIFRELMDMEIAKAAAAQNALGVGKALFKELNDLKG